MTMSFDPEGIKNTNRTVAGVNVENSASLNITTVTKPLTVWGKLWSLGFFRKLCFIAVLAIAWQSYAIRLNNPLILPSFTLTLAALWDSLIHGELLSRIFVSLQTLIIAYCGGIILATGLTVLAISTRIGNDLLETLTSMFNPLPAIALLPLALLWFGLGNPSMIFVLIHSVIWPISLNIHTGFTGVSPTLRMVGRNLGFSGFRYVRKILIPAALPHILTGLKNGWAFAWRTLIAAELVFGVSSSSGGLGWFIFEKKNQLEIAHVFAGLCTVILIGIIVENIVFRLIENKTVQRWGMKA